LGRDEYDEFDVPAHKVAGNPLREAPAGDGALLGADEVPERLVIPVFPFDGDGFVRLQLQLIRCGDSLLAPGFTRAQLLVERLGEFQPWLSVPGASLVQLVNASAIAGVVIDPASNMVEAVWTREALVALREVNDARL
jgi:hypothetical protein